MKKALVFSVLSLFVLGIFAFNASYVDAYVSVRGYTKSNGTYVAPHVRSNPNGLKYDNYSYKPSQGLYNKTYGTRGTTWDTPTYITDPNYYVGKSLYDSGSVGGASTSAYVTPSATNTYVPANAKLDYYGSSWYCNSGYKIKYDNSFNKIGCEQIIVPANAVLSSTGSDWYCNSGYKTKYDSYYNKIGCEQVIVPANAKLDYYGSDWYCNSGYKTKYDNSFNKIGCEQVIVPPNAKLDYYGSSWYCNSGYRTTYDSSYNKIGCEQIIVPANAKLDYYGSDWYCNSGYKTKYDSYYNKIGCDPQ